MNTAICHSVLSALGYDTESSDAQIHGLRIKCGVTAYFCAAILLFMLAGCTPGPSNIVFVTHPSTTVSGRTINTVVVHLRDASGLYITKSNDPVTIEIATNPSSGTLTGTTTVNAIGGIAIFSDLHIDKAGVGYTLVASTPSLKSAQSFAFEIKVGPPAKLKYLTMPGQTTSQASITPVQIRVEDVGGNLVTAQSVPITVSLSGGTGVLGGTKTVDSVNGIATFSDLNVDLVGTTYQLVATSGGLHGATSDVFTIIPGPPASLNFTSPISTTVSEVPIANLAVALKDAAGNVTTSTDLVTLSIATNVGPGTLSGTTSATAINGIATFNNASIDIAGSGYRLSASSASVPTIQSNAFDIIAGPPFQLAFDQQPSSSVSEQAISPSVTVLVKDHAGNRVASATNPVSIALVNNPSSGILLGGGPTTPANATATFANLSINKVGTGYTLVATSPGLTSSTSNGFNITFGAPARLAFASQPTNAASESSISPAITVQVLDNAGNLVTNATNTVHVAIANNPNSGILAGSTTISSTNGTATFSNLNIDKAGSGYTLSASSNTLASATSNAFNINPGPPKKLAFVAQPTKTVIGYPLSPAVTVNIQDNAGNFVPSATNSVTIALGNNPSSGVLSGVLSTNAINGVATFSQLRMSVAGIGNSLVATSNGLTQSESSAFDIFEAATWSRSCVLPSGTIDTYADLAPNDRYADNANGTVTDLCTNLMWEQPSNAGPMLLANAKTYCDALNIGGQADWRLPTRSELNTLVDYTQGDLASIPAINPNIFADDPISRPTWSITPVAGNAANSWVIDFFDGSIGNGVALDDSDEVRCVRNISITSTAANASNHYSVNNLNNTVTDAFTGLIWQKDLTDSDVGSTQTDAIAQCQALGTGWRLPTVKELSSLVDLAVASPGPMINDIFPPPTVLLIFWSSSLVAGAPESAWGVDFANGSVTTYNATEIDNSLDFNRVRCVK